MGWKGLGQSSAGQASRIWEPEAEVTLEGKYIGKREAKGKMLSDMYEFSVGDEIVGAWGSSVIESQMEKLGVKEGDLVKISFLGKVKGKTGRVYKNYAVEVWEDEEGVELDEQ